MDSVERSPERIELGYSKQCLRGNWLEQGQPPKAFTGARLEQRQVLKALLLRDELRVSLCRITNAALKLGMLERVVEANCTAPATSFFSSSGLTTTRPKASRREGEEAVAGEGLGAGGSQLEVAVEGEEEAVHNEVADEGEVLSGRRGAEELQTLEEDELDKLRLLLVANLVGK